MKITYEMLVEWNACKPRRDAFREQFPDGATIEEAGAWALNDDLQWVVCYASPALGDQASAELLRRKASDDCLNYIVRNASPAMCERARAELDRRSA